MLCPWQAQLLGTLRHPQPACSLQVDLEKKQVTVEAGILLADLHPELDKHGLALSK